jgi:hypothetical protein
VQLLVIRKRRTKYTVRKLKQRVSFVSGSRSCSRGGFTVTRVYLTVRYQLHTVNVLAMCSSPSGCTVPP